MHAVASDAPGQIHVLLLHGAALGMNCAQIRVLEQADDVRFGGLLEGLQRLRLESKLVVHVDRDASHQSLEGSPRQKAVNGLLVALDLPQSDSSGLEALLSLLLDATRGWSTLLDGLTALFDLHWHLVGCLGFGSDLGFWHLNVV